MRMPCWSAVLDRRGRLITFVAYFALQLEAHRARAQTELPALKDSLESVRRQREVRLDELKMNNRSSGLNKPNHMLCT